MAGRHRDMGQHPFWRYPSTAIMPGLWGLLQAVQSLEPGHGLGESGREAGSGQPRQSSPRRSEWQGGVHPGGEGNITVRHAGHTSTTVARICVRLPIRAQV